MSSNTNTKLAPPQQDLKDDSSEWESPDENEKDKAPSKRSPPPLYQENQRVELLTSRGWDANWVITRVHRDNNTYDVRHLVDGSIKNGVRESSLK
ncbi:hypothetical protein CERZMDRAFT_95885 [Cercospora zeae-maydis SCOH1-5]|uniref:Uncharacterized protein n=1 Tax=Cercospora zeae-maydis SCOH1-5 TaxID=717836 RepID=A0A6A6FK94_9PEZI|nr:hypothetical protein CERZMDRAFT_95885 [Cercospora zeae-maydis SCOH1-5]